MISNTMSLNKAQMGQLAALAGITTLVFSWSSSADITAPFLPNLGNSIPSTLSGMGVLVVLVERSTEVVVNAIRSEEIVMKSQLARIELKLGNASQEYHELAEKLEMYKSGTQRLSLLVGLAIGVLVACTGVGFLSSILNSGKSIPVNLQLRRGVDILLTAGLLAGGSQAFHENVANQIRDAVSGGTSK
jgi:hypothetical protein